MELTVGKEYQTVQEAIDAVPYDTPATIHVPAGVWHERISCEKRDITLIGEGMEKTSLVNEAGAREIMPDGTKRGTFRTQTAFFRGEKLTLRDMNISNYAGAGWVAGQALALYLDVRSAHLSHVSLHGFQDTLFLAPLPEEEREENGFRGPGEKSQRLPSTVVVEHSVISGDIDFIFGGADALFHDCDIVSMHQGYVAAPSGKKSGRGFVFHRCRFIPGPGVPDGSVYVMRPWRPEGKVAVIDCTFGPHVNRAGIHPWPGREDEIGLATWNHYAAGAKDNTLSEKDVMLLIAGFGRGR